MEESSSSVWPMLDFDKFPNGMITGLTLEEINEYLEEDLQREAIAGTSTSKPTNSVHLFSKPTDDESLEKLKMKSIPWGTRQRNSWALALYSKWHSQRELLNDEKFAIPTKDGLLLSNVECLNYWLPKFIFELRKSDGSRYPRNSLISIVAGFNQYFQSNDRHINLFKDDDFRHFRDVLDLACKESSRELTNISKRQADVITRNDEEKMWTLGVLGSDTPKKLIDTLLFLNGLHFALRSGHEHRSLSIKQVRVTEPNDECKFYCLEYTETVSKTNNGGLKSRKLEPKRVKHVDTDSIDNPSRSHALIFLKYINLRPKNASDIFYLSPNQSGSSNWFKVSLYRYR